MTRALLLALLIGSAQAETLLEYGRQCAAEVTAIPSFNCMDGELIPITVDGKTPEKYEPNMRCDRPSLLPANEPGAQGQCLPGSRALVLRDDATAQISAICRKKLVRPIDSHEFDEINVVSHNLKNGKTCWFTAKAKEPFGQHPPIDGRQVASPSPVQKGAERLWQSPLQVARSGPACMSCHDSGPFMYSPYIAQTTKLPGDPFGRYLPKAIGADFKREWKHLEAFGITTRGNTCTACHRVGNMNSCQVAMWQSVGKAAQPGADEWASKFPQSHWMSPGNLHSRLQWDETFNDSLKKLAACCQDPNGAGCLVQDYKGASPSTPRRP